MDLLPQAFPFTIGPERPQDASARESLLDRAMGRRRKLKSSEKLRRGRLPSPGLALAAHDGQGRLVGTVRLWDVALGDSGRGALLLGPLAVEPALKGVGIGSALMREAIAEARRLGHKAILLVGDAPYYARFGFSAEKTARLAMPGPYERERFVALELEASALDGVFGVLKPAGRKAQEAEKSGVSASLRLPIRSPSRPNGAHLRMRQGGAETPTSKVRAGAHVPHPWKPA